MVLYCATVKHLLRCWGVVLLLSVCWGQEAPLPNAPEPQKDHGRIGSTLVQLRDLPAEWLIGPYIPSTRPLVPLTLAERTDVYFHQTYFSAGPYVLHLFTAGVDQARGVPSQWGGGMSAYGKRFGNRYGQFMITNTFVYAGDAALGYESRYDLCHCHGFWPRTKHAVARNFVTYNRTESELRPAVPLYVGSFGAGMLSKEWLPGQRNIWTQGAYAAASQAGWGSAYNFASEFAFDILRKVTGGKYPPNGSRQ